MSPGSRPRRGPLRVIVDGAAAATWNMAVDEALLRAGDRATLRCYGWSPHAVSLGWFQRWQDFADLPEGTPLVRRLTGGGAIHHGDELTCSLTCDADVLPGDIGASYRLLHDAAIAVLRRIGVPCRRLEAGAAQAARPAERWCFAVPGRDDVLTDRGKLLGSAQRRLGGPRPRILHHGSLVLRRPALTPFVAAVGDTTGKATIDVDALRAELVEQFAKALDLMPTPGALTPAERALAATLQTSRYGNYGFSRQR